MSNLFCWSYQLCLFGIFFRSFLGLPGCFCVLCAEWINNRKSKIPMQNRFGFTATMFLDKLMSLFLASQDNFFLTFSDNLPFVIKRQIPLHKPAISKTSLIFHRATAAMLGFAKRCRFVAVITKVTIAQIRPKPTTFLITHADAIDPILCSENTGT